MLDRRDERLRDARPSCDVDLPQSGPQPEFAERAADPVVIHARIVRTGALPALNCASLVTVRTRPDAVSGDDGMPARLLGWALDHAQGRTAAALRIATGDDRPTGVVTGS